MNRTPDRYNGRPAKRTGIAILAAVIAIVVVIAAGCATGPRGVVATGTVEVHTRAAGVLYVDRSPVAELGAGEQHVQELEWGTVRLRMRFADGSRETRRVEVPMLETVRVMFGYGIIEIRSHAAGRVKIDDEFVGQVSDDGVLTMADLVPAEYSVEIRYYDGYVESRTVAVGSSSKVSVAFERRYYAVGDRGPAGGVVFYDKGEHSDGWRYLEAAPFDQSSNSVWGGSGATIGGTSHAVGSGASNTERIVNRLGTASRYAARVCSELELGGHTDWFLPSVGELAVMYRERQIIGGFAATHYWSSTEQSQNAAWFQGFAAGGRGPGAKNETRARVRAIRSF